MAFSSKLYSGEPLFNDATPEYITHDPAFGRGLELGLKGPNDYDGVADPFPKELEIDPSEFEARIKEKEERGNRISDIINYYKLPSKNQRSTNYCWINAPVGAMEFVRLRQNQPMISLSPASAGAQIKNYRNVGGWGLEALQFIADKGVAPSSLWPDTAINSQYATPETLATMLKFRATEWMVLKPRNNNQIASCVLQNIPVPVGYNWWGHEVYVVDAVWLDGQLAWRIRNSWYLSETVPWGSNGFGLIQGQKMYADDAVAPRVAVATSVVPLSMGIEVPTVV